MRDPAPEWDPRTGRGIPPLSHEGAAEQLKDNHVFLCLFLIFFTEDWVLEGSTYLITFNYHWEGRGDPDFPKGECVLAYSILSACKMLRPLFLALTASHYLFSVGPVVLCGRKSSIITPTFNKRKHKPRCAKGMRDLVYQLLGDRVELASELSDLQFIRIKLRSNVGGEMLPVGIFFNICGKRRVFAFITSSTTAGNILGLHAYVRINNKRDQGVDHLPLTVNP